MKKKSIVPCLLFFLVPFAFVISGLHAQNPESEILVNQELFRPFTFRNVGPSRGGRVTAVEGVHSQPATFYMGSTGGGVWKTKDYGHSWENISDGYFITPSIGAISVFQVNPDIIYVGTGSDGLRSNVITGKGVYKSINGGRTWEHSGLTNAGQIGAVEIHPDNKDIVFVAAIGQAFQPNKERGVFRTRNGGQTWEQVLYLSDTIGAIDLEFAPADPDIIYASMWRAERKPWTIISGGYKAGGIYRSTDGGDSWKKLDNGLPQGLIGKIDLAVSPADPDRLYALVEAPEGEGGLYRSDNRGKSFTLVSTKRELVNRPFYYCNVEANPQNADALYVLAVGFYYSSDGGYTWKSLRTPHGDNHDIRINRNDTLIFIQSNDGGANVTIDGGMTWSTQYNQPTAELYQVEVDDQYPYWLYAGQQDNSTIAVPSLPPWSAPIGASGFWMSVGGCETGPAVPKPGNPDIVYSNCKGRFGVYNKRTGQEQQYYVGAINIYSHNPKDLKFRFQRVAPIHVSPHNPDVVYHASQYLHKTIDEGRTWEIISPDLTAFEPDKQVISGSPITRDITGEEYYSTIYSVRESPLRAGLIWVGANDGPVHVTGDGGENWENVTPGDLPPGGRVDCVEPSPHDANKAYIAVLRYQLGDWHPYIFKTEDLGNTWTLLTNGINGIPADYPTRVVREDPDIPGLLYAGTEFGIYISFDDGKNWKSFQQNLPVTPVTDIKIHRKDLVVSTMGRSFWIMDNVSSLHQLATAERDPATTLFKPKDTYHYRYRGTSQNNVPYYPAPSVIIDYYLGEETTTIKLEITDRENRVIRSYSNKEQTDNTNRTEETEMASGFFRSTPSTILQTNPGMCRFHWDMSHDGPWDKNPGRSFRNGPAAAPGEYLVRLIVDGQIFTQSFKLQMDPRVEKSGVSPEDLKAQEILALQIRELISRAKKAADLINQRQEELANLLEKEKKNQNYKQEVDELIQMENQLVTPAGNYITPRLIDQLNYLASMLNRADQRPGKDAYERYTELNDKLVTLISSSPLMKGLEMISNY